MKALLTLFSGLALMLTGCGVKGDLSMKQDAKAPTKAEAPVKDTTNLPAALPPKGQ